MKLNMNFHRSGNALGETVVFIHSLASTAEMWWPQQGLLDHKYDVIYYDIRGHGDSACPSGDWSLEDMAKDLWDLYKWTNKEKIHIVGLSMGGMIAQMFTALHPEAVHSLVLANTMCFYGSDKQAMWNERIAMVRNGGIEAIVEPTAKRWFTEEFYNSEPDDIEIIRTLIRKTTDHGFIACCEALKRMDLRAEIKDFTVRTAIIVGKYDPTTPVRESEYLAAHIRCSKLTVIDNAAHISNVEQRAAFNAVLREHFLC